MASQIPVGIETMQQYFQQEHYGPFVRPVSPEISRGSAWLIHGFLGTPADMHGLADLMQSLGLDTAGPLVPGMAGQLDQLGAMTAKHWRANALAGWERFVVEHPGPRVLLGYSMGGTLALHIAATTATPPDLLILLAPFMRIGDWRGNVLPIAKHLIPKVNFFKDADLGNPATWDWFHRAMPEVDLDDPRVREALRNDYVAPTAALDQLRMLATGVRRAAKSMTVPTVIVQGHDDDVVLPRDTHAMASVLPTLLEYHEIRADHMLAHVSFPWWTEVRDLVESAVRYHLTERSATD
jgi:carboxylesterase